ncbi:MAG: hypothetical protein IKY87_03480 [Paludibacteraceae bacterium]|nr:hypothetical protein [Paludibacteraceae bacterium]
MRKIFLFLFAAVLSIGTAMAELVTITENQCTLEYEVDGRALYITGDYLGDPFSLTLLSENDIDLTAESFVCDVQSLNIANYSKYADRGTATVKVYPYGIGISATGLYDFVGDDPNTYDLVDLWAEPKEAAGGDDVSYDAEFTVDMTGLEATMELTFAASGQSDDTQLGGPLGTVVTYLECDWEAVDGALPVLPGNSSLTLADHGLLGEVLAGSVVPVLDASETAFVSATAVVYVYFEDMGTFKFTLNMTAGSSEEPGEPGESATVSVQVWNATLSQQYGTLMLDGSMNGVAVHAEVPEFEFVPDTWDRFDYSNVMVEVGTWGESDYVGMAYGDATVELDQNTVTITGTMTTSGGTTFVAYIQGSLQPADPMASTTLTMEGLTKSEVNRGMGRGFTQLADASDNSIEIYNLQEDGTFAYGDYLKVTANINEVSLEGSGSWQEVDGTETLIATLYDDYYTEVYYVTATVAGAKTITLTCSDAVYYKNEYNETIFTGVTANDESVKLTIANLKTGINTADAGRPILCEYGPWYDPTYLQAESVTVTAIDLTTYTVTGEFTDGINTYNVTITATPMPIIDMTITDAVYEKDEYGNIYIKAEWNGTTVNFELPVWAGNEGEYSDVYFTTGNGMGDDDFSATAGYALLETTTTEFTLTGTFTHDWEQKMYNATISGTFPVFTRTVTSGNYGTICLPFGSTEFSGATFYEVVGKETGKVYLGSVSTLVAGVPYIFQASANELTVYSNGTTTDEAGSKNGLIGNFTDETVVPAGHYILYSNAFIPADGTTNKVNANRAYLNMNAITGGKPQQVPGRRYIGMDVQDENEATGVDNITTGAEVVKTIENGQLIIIRENVKYNAQGQKL